MKNRKVQQVANSLSMLANLPTGDALIHILGVGNEASNQEALCSWVRQQEDLLSIDKPDYMVEQLMHRLHSKLNSFSSYLCEINQ